MAPHSSVALRFPSYIQMLLCRTAGGVPLCFVKEVCWDTESLPHFPHQRLGVEGGSCSGVSGPRQQKGKGHRERSSTDLLICVVFVFLVSFFLSLSWKEVTSSQKNGERELQTQGTVQPLNECCFMNRALGRLYDGNWEAGQLLYRISVANTKS